MLDSHRVGPVANGVHLELLAPFSCLAHTPRYTIIPWSSRGIETLVSSIYTSWCILNPIQFISQSFSYKFSTHKHLQPMFSHIPDQGTFDWSRSVASMIQTPLSPGFQDCIISLPRTTKNPSSALSACSLALCSSKVLEALGPTPQERAK